MRSTLLSACLASSALLACSSAPERSAVLSTSGAAGGAVGGLSSTLGTASAIASATGSLAASATGITSSTGTSSTFSASSLSGVTSSLSGATSSTGSTGATSTTGGSTGSCPPPTTIAAARSACNVGQAAALEEATVLYADSSGAAVDGGGTKHSASYVLVDSSGLGVLAYHAASDPFPGYNPDSQDSVSATGDITIYPAGDGELQLSAPVFTLISAGNPLPQPAAATAPQLVGQPTDPSMLAHYVTIPAGAYTQNYAEPTFTSGKYQDGVSITDGSGNTILVDFYALTYSDYVDGASCYPTADGGFPDLSAGGFNGFYDLAKTDDGNVNAVVFYGNCGQ